MNYQLLNPAPRPSQLRLQYIKIMLAGQRNHVERMGTFADVNGIPVADIEAFLAAEQPGLH